MAEPSTYDMFALLKKNSYVDGWAVNIWPVFASKYFYFKIGKYRLVICWWLSRQHTTSLKVVICWRLSHQHMICFYFSLLICAIGAEGRDLMYHTTSVRTTHLSHWGLNICTEKLPHFSIQMTANRGLGIAYSLSVMASPEIIGVYFWNFSFKFWIGARTGFWSINA